MLKMIKNKKLFVTVLAFMFAVIVAAMAGIGSAKYVGQKNVNGTIGLKADLAGSIKVYEHVAARQTDGSYDFGTSTTEGDQTYMLMPGVDVKKDPTVRLTGYTGLPAYLFITVTDDIPTDDDYVTYSVAEGWTVLEGVSGVWYKELTVSDVPQGTETYKDYPILAQTNGYQLIVSDALPRDTQYELSFSACIGQKTTENNTPATVYAALNGAAGN